MISFQTIVLIISFLQLGTCDFSDKTCNGVSCEAPPKDAKCEIVNDSDKVIPRPTGPKAHCCPLWKCKRSNDLNFFTFHGLQGGGKGVDGSETVRYENTGQMGRSVLSTASGAHDSAANAGDQLDMAELAAALKADGIMF